MEGSFSIRPASTDDLSRLLEIEAQVHAAPWSKENFEAELSKPYSQTLVLTDDETDSLIAGYIIFWILFDECQIHNLAVDLPYRGIGFAKRLMRSAVNQALKKNIKKILLDVRKSNQAAIQLYQNLGFTITHVRKSFYSNGEDAYQMSLFLDQTQQIDF